MTRALARGYVNKSRMYDRGRPLYPRDALLFMQQHLDLSLSLPVLDVGSGTGILTRQLAATGMQVLGVEPDAQMLAKARAHKGQPLAEYHCGTAEQLGVAANSAAALICGQSFHWFEPTRTLAEFQRVLATNNPVFLIWNIRSPDFDEFHCAYEQLLKNVFKRYAETLLIDEALDRKLTKFFPRFYKENNFQHDQTLDLKGLIERTMSCSYAPPPGTIFNRPWRRRI